MNKLKLYRVDVNYIKYLYSFDNKVQYNKEQKDEYTRKRPYLGVVLQVNEFEYFVPLEHPREAHQKMKDNIYILKIHNGKYGILGFNNMIPIKREELIEFNINNELNTTKTIDKTIHKKYIFVRFNLKLAEQLGQICFPNKEPKYLFAVSSTFSLQFGQFINLPFFLILS